MSEAAIAVFLARAFATAGVVVGVTLLVGRLGARVGGIVAGLPIVVGPGVFFLLRQEGADFVVTTLAPAIYAIAAGVVYAWVFARLAPRHGPWVCLLAGVLAWLIVVLLFAQLPQYLPLAVLVFVLTVVIAARVGDPPGLRDDVPTAARRPLDLVLRGACAGLAVGLVGLIAPHAGPLLSGSLLAFPVALTVISVTLHQRYGWHSAARALGTVRVAMLSIAAFALALDWLLPHLAPMPAFWLAILASLLPTSLMMVLHARTVRKQTEIARGR